MRIISSLMAAAILEGILPAGSAMTAHDQVCLANDTQFNESYLVTALSQYSVGWRDPNNLDAFLGFLAPDVETNRNVNYTEAINSEEFLADSQQDLIREIGADFKEAKDYTGKVSTAVIPNRGLSIRIDKDRVKNMPNWQERFTGRLLSRIKRSECRQAVVLLSAAATNTNRTWNSASNPNYDLRTSLAAAADVQGFKPNRMVIGETAWNLRDAAYEAQATAAGFARIDQTPEQLGAWLGDVKVYKSTERYQTSLTAKAQFLNNKIISYTAMDGLMEDDASNIKRFVAMTDQGGKYAVYLQDVSAKFYLLTVECYSVIKITSTLGIRQETIS